MRPALKFVAQVVIMFGLIGLAGSIMFLVGELSSGDTPVALYGLTADLALTLLAGVVVILAAKSTQRLFTRSNFSRWPWIAVSVSTVKTPATRRMTSLIKSVFSSFFTTHEIASPRTEGGGWHESPHFVPVSAEPCTLIAKCCTH